MVESLNYCIEVKGLIVYAWCVMSNHVHLIISTKGNNTSDVLEDFKKFTSKRIIKAIQENNSESRKEWMLEIFKRAGGANSRNEKFQFWRQENQPKELFSGSFANQKLDYIHNNPVEAGIVEKAEAYIYSSASDYFNGKNMGLVPIEFLC